MNYKAFISILIITLLLSGCDMISGVATATPTATPSEATSTPVPVNTVGITPNVTEETTASPTAEATPSPTVHITAQSTTAAPTEDPDKAQRTQDMNSFLPSLDTQLNFYGIAETGHFGELSMSYSDADEASYLFSGTYNDGMGVPDEFAVQYFFNYNRGTITEKALYNERLDKNEFHSKLHNIVVLKFPLSLGATWSHETTIEGSKYWVYAEVIEYSSSKVKIIYTAPNVPGYYNDTYFEMRTYEVGYGMTSFGNIMTGDLDMTGVDTSDEAAVLEHIMNMHMFGYSLNR